MKKSHGLSENMAGSHGLSFEFPNPTTGNLINIDIVAEERQSVSLRLFGYQGQVLSETPKNTIHPGRSQFSFIVDFFPGIGESMPTIVSVVTKDIVMRRTQLFQFVVLVLFFLINGCQSNTQKGETGSLFIIGGGQRPPELMQQLLDAANLQPDDYILILPFSSIEPVESSRYVTKQILELGVSTIKTLFLNTDSLLSASALDSVREARLIYITGGNQNLFMKTAKRTGLTTAIHDAYNQGAMIAGTSAGAAVMSKKMITGNQLSLAEYSGNFRTIHQNNIEISEGLGLLNNAIIDQHFIQRARMNRLLSVAIEYPDELCIGIDESTAILVNGDNAIVVGSSQVVVVSNHDKLMKTHNGLLGAEDLQVKVLLPGDSFKID